MLDGGAGVILQDRRVWQLLGLKDSKRMSMEEVFRLGENRVIGFRSEYNSYTEVLYYESWVQYRRNGKNLGVYQIEE